MQFESSSAGKAIAGLRIVGYGILVLCLFDIIDLLYPLQLFNSDWEFNTIGNFVERVGFPLIGFGCVFLGEESNRHQVERFIVKPLSWLLLAYAIVYLLFVPLTISAGWRIHNQNNIQLVGQLAQQRDQAKAAQDQLDKLSDDQLKAVIQKSAAAPLENFNPSEFRKKQIEGLNAQLQQAEAQVKATVAQQTKNLTKKGIKWTLGALISGTVFLYLWYLTGWARQKKMMKKTRSVVMSQQ